MAIHLIDIKPADLESVKRLITEGRYENLEQFMEVAIRNQILYETHGGIAALQNVNQDQSKLLEESSSRQNAPSSTARFVPKPIWLFVGSNVPILDSVPPTNRPLFGQYYRFLPVKLVVRLLAQLQLTSLPELEDFKKAVAREAEDFATYLSALEKLHPPSHGLSLTAGLPNKERDVAKSRDRFIDQYLGRVRSNGRLSGFPEDLGFIGLQAVNNKRYLVGLTKAGFEFTSLPNPILDTEEASRALGDEEVQFLLRHISQSMPGEREHLREVVRLLSEGVDTPSELSVRLSAFYRGRFPDESWTDAKVSLTRAGAISRLVEMGIIEGKKHGVKMRYHPSTRAAEAIQQLLKSTADNNSFD